jgi:hypothetical protein
VGEVNEGNKEQEGGGLDRGERGWISQQSARSRIMFSLSNYSADCEMLSRGKERRGEERKGEKRRGEERKGEERCKMIGCFTVYACAESCSISCSRKRNRTYTNIKWHPFLKYILSLSISLSPTDLHTLSLHVPLSPSPTVSYIHSLSLSPSLSPSHPSV